MGKKHKATDGNEILTVQGSWGGVLLACRKCGGKLKGGFGPKGKDKLPAALRQLLRETGRRQALRILEVGCLGVCPKGGVVVMHGAQPGEMLVVPERMDLARLAALLPGLAPPQPEAIQD